MWFSRSVGGASALVFFIAALPFVVSYLSNIDLVDEKLTRTAIFAFCLVGSSLLVDVSTVLVLRNEYSALSLGAVYFGQAVAYIVLGHLTLETVSGGDTFGEYRD
jgi:hypothetical protein